MKGVWQDSLIFYGWAPLNHSEPERQTCLWWLHDPQRKARLATYGQKRQMKKTKTDKSETDVEWMRSGHIRRWAHRPHGWAFVLLAHMDQMSCAPCPGSSANAGQYAAASWTADVQRQLPPGMGKDQSAHHGSSPKDEPRRIRIERACGKPGLCLLWSQFHPVISPMGSGWETIAAGRICRDRRPAHLQRHVRRDQRQARLKSAASCADTAWYASLLYMVNLNDFISAPSHLQNDSASDNDDGHDSHDKHLRWHAFPPFKTTCKPSLLFTPWLSLFSVHVMLMICQRIIKKLPCLYKWRHDKWNHFILPDRHFITWGVRLHSKADWIAPIGLDFKIYWIHYSIMSSKAALLRYRGRYLLQYNWLL